MTRQSASVVFLLLILIWAGISAAITVLRADLTPFDPKLTVGLTVITFAAVMTSIGFIAILNLLICAWLRRPVVILAWILPGTALLLLAHSVLAAPLGLTPIARLGWGDAFLMYLPATGFLSLVGGWIGQLIQPK